MEPSCGFQGVPGAYSEACALEVFGAADISVKAIGYGSFEEVFTALADKEVQFAVLPFENTLGGSIHVNYDLLLRFHGRVHIIGEHSFRVRHALLALPDAERSQITKVMSHPQALAQTEGYLRAEKLTPVAAYDTAGSAKIIVEQGLRDTAAVASMHAAKVHGLKVLDYGIEDDSNNFTRFLVLSNAPNSPPAGTPLKTSVVFVPRKDEAGALFKALSVFAVREINLSKIESRPFKPGTMLDDDTGASDEAEGSPSQPQKRQRVNGGEAAGGTKPQSSGASFEYAFYVDLLVSTTEKRAQNAIRHLGEISRVVRVLGCFPADGVMLERRGSSEQSYSEPLPIRACAAPFKVAIIGFGPFGQFLARRWVARGHVVVAYSARTDYSAKATEMGVRYARSVAELTAERVDCLIFSVSIISFENVIAKMGTELFASALVVDVLSVKAHAKQTMLRLLPPSADVLCMHPMFGPESGKHGWQGLPCVYDQVRVSDYHRAARLLSLFEDEGCRMVKMSCEEHDRHAAGSQFVTHLTGRLLGKLRLQPSPIATKGFEALLRLVDNTCKDSFDLFYALYSHNSNSGEQLQQFADALDELRKDLLTFSAASEQNPSAQRISRLVSGVPASQTVAISDLAIDLKRKGVPVISLSVGEPDFPPPPAVMAAAHEALDQGKTKYTAMAGTHELRSAICEMLLKRKGVRYTPEQVLCGNGGKQGILQAMLALCNPGDEVIIPAPYWTSYPAIAQLCRATPVVLEMKAEEDYCTQPEALEAAITPRTRIFVLCNPSNPTGAVHPKPLLERLAEVIAKHPQVVVLSDEIYDAITFDEPHVCFASLPGMYERTVLVNGFSKGSAMTGFRLGYIAAPLPITKAAAKVQSSNTSCACAISQHAAVAALTAVDDEFLKQQIANFRGKRDFVISRLRAMPGVTCTMPQGAFYAFPTISAFFGRRTPGGAVIADALSLCEYLMRECHVAVVPGEAFGAPSALRISYATSMEALASSLDQIERGLAALLPAA